MIKQEEIVIIGSIWEHYNGNKYEVILLTNENSGNEKYPITVVHKGENGNIWSRPLSEWKRSFTKIN